MKITPEEVNIIIPTDVKIPVANKIANELMATIHYPREIKYEHMYDYSLKIDQNTEKILEKNITKDFNSKNEHKNIWNSVNIASRIFLILSFATLIPNILYLIVAVLLKKFAPFSEINRVLAINWIIFFIAEYIVWFLACAKILK
ncbi:hypothetical protein EDEG_03809, partial [Edhazardia aedis USNM 41457]